MVRRDGFSMRRNSQIDIPLQFQRSVGHEISPELKQSSNMSFKSQALRKRYCGEWMQLNLEFRDNSEVAASAAQSPKQLRILSRIRAHYGTVCCYQPKSFDVIARQSKSPSQPSRSAAQNQSRCSGVRHHTGGEH